MMPQVNKIIITTIIVVLIVLIGVFISDNRVKKLEDENKELLQNIRELDGVIEITKEKIIADSIQIEQLRSDRIIIDSKLEDLDKEILIRRRALNRWEFEQRQRIKRYNELKNSNEVKWGEDLLKSVKSKLDSL